MQQFLNVTDIAKRLGVSPSTVRKLADQGIISSIRSATGWRLFPNYENEHERVKRYIQDRKEKLLRLKENLE